MKLTIYLICIIIDTTVKATDGFIIGDDGTNCFRILTEKRLRFFVMKESCKTVGVRPTFSFILSAKWSIIKQNDNFSTIGPISSRYYRGKIIWYLASRWVKVCNGFIPRYFCPSWYEKSNHFSCIVCFCYFTIRTM